MSMAMQIEEIKAVILALPNKEIGPLHNWLQDYYDGEVWDRQIENDFKELGAETLVQVLQSGMAQASEKRQAALRLMNNMQCHPVPASGSAACCSCTQALFMNSACDETEEVRRSRLAVINSRVETHDSNAERKRLEAQYGRVWDTAQLSEDFEVLGFMAPFVVVRSKSDGRKGSLEFQHHPRFYFSFVLD